MKVIFLDIDGVVNSGDWFAKSLSTKDEAQFDPEACARVQRLCDETGAKIVISSTWRMMKSVSWLRDMFAKKGLTASVIGKTPYLVGKARGEEIQRFLTTAKSPRFPEPIESMVILDDNSDMCHLKPWLVKTSFYEGFCDKHIERALAVLEKPMPEVRR